MHGDAEGASAIDGFSRESLPQQTWRRDLAEFLVPVAGRGQHRLAENALAASSEAFQSGLIELFRM